MSVIFDSGCLLFQLENPVTWFTKVSLLFKQSPNLKPSLGEWWREKVSLIQILASTVNILDVLLGTNSLCDEYNNAALCAWLGKPKLKHTDLTEFMPPQTCDSSVVKLVSTPTGSPNLATIRNTGDAELQPIVRRLGCNCSGLGVSKLSLRRPIPPPPFFFFYIPSYGWLSESDMKGMQGYWDCLCGHIGWVALVELFDW